VCCLSEKFVTDGCDYFVSFWFSSTYYIVGNESFVLIFLYTYVSLQKERGGGGGGGGADDCWRWFPIAFISEHTSFNCQPTSGAPRLLAT